MKASYLIHIVAIMTLALGVWIFYGDSDGLAEKTNPQAVAKKGMQPINPHSGSHTDSGAVDKEIDSAFSSVKQDVFLQDSGELAVSENTAQHQGSEYNNGDSQSTAVNPVVIIGDYISAWRNKDKDQLDSLWEKISTCQPCLSKLVEMIVNKNLEEGLMLEAAIKMAALDTNVVLPVFDSIIDPAGNRSAAIILSEKVINNGRPEFVSKIFDVIYRAQQNGYDNFARQLTWVISKLDNNEGLRPILDTITGRRVTSEKFSDHVSNVFSRVVYNLAESDQAAKVIADYYLEASGQEQQKLWNVVSQHSDTLVLLAANADSNGQNYNVQKYATAITELPNLQAVDGLLKLHMNVEYSPDYLVNMLKESVVKNPTVKVLRKLEDYMRDPAVDMETRIFAAEGLLSVRNNRHARYLLEKVINNSQYAEPELQAYIGGRL